MSDPARRKARDQYLRRTYGVSLEEFDAILEYQGGTCAVCPSTGGSRSLHLDHDHATGYVRGILCFRHNALLLGRGVTAEVLTSAAAYLDLPPALVVLAGYREVKAKPRRRRRRRK